MGEGKTQNPQQNHAKKMISFSSSSCSSSSIGEDDDSTVSNGSLFSSNDGEETRDDASSTATCSSSTYDLSELMAELPIKRGLSQFYHGKSDSFTNLAMVTSIGDLPKKKEEAKKAKKKGLEAYKLYTLPRAKISKKSSLPRRSFFNSKPPQMPHTKG